jgi:cysteate synthase
LKAIKAGNVGGDDIILLNIAGGGYERLKEDFTLFKIPQVVTARSPDIPLEDLNI